MTPDFYRLSVRELGRYLRDGQLSARSLLDHYLERIERINPTLNAIIALDVMGATRAADDADARLRKGQALSALDGIPVAIKDNILVKGQPAVWGSRFMEGNIATHDELPITLLREAGAVLIGKTNVPEFTLRGYTGNPVFGVTGNPWNPERTPGGSSGGSVAAVAAGLVPLSLGTDGGGSIRRPAGYAGLVGLKPTLSRIPRADGLPQVLYDCEIVGPIGRSTDDVRLMMATIAKADRRDQRSRGFAPISEAASAPGRRKILFVEQFGSAPVDPEISASCRQAAEVLRTLGHEVISGPLPFSIDRLIAEWAKLGNVGLSLLAQRDARFYDLASPAFADQARAGNDISGGAFLDVIEMLFAFRSEVGKAFGDIDLIMTPTAAANPWPKAEAFPPVIDGKEVGPRGHAVFTNWVNACGHPGIALPAAQTRDGMPIGFQLVGDFGADDLLLDIAAQYEAASPWAARWPAVASL
jgi:aspartyl-tRNA(Asn)/glutamyl-tRNA(Gln) amidotransferase subunit A